MIASGVLGSSCEGRIMFNHRLEHQGRTRGFLIETRAAGGWDVLEEQDRRVVREVHYDDWHRVERQLSVFALRVELLKNEGWVPVGATSGASAPRVRHAGGAR
jgi:hypothetical protein